MTYKRLFRFLWDAMRDFMSDDAATLAAALSFYAALALAPLVMIFMFIAGLAGPDAQQQLQTEIQKVVGPQAGDVIRIVIMNVQVNRSAGALSAIIGLITLLLSSTGVFAQLQYSMNRIWDVHDRPGRDVFLWLRQRLLSLGIMAVVAFLSLVSLAVSTVLNLLFSRLSLLWDWVDLGVSYAVYVLLFALIFKVMPDVRLRWRDVWWGANVTALLFVIGKFAIGKYLGVSTIGSAYGAAGSLVILLLWLYYTSLIVFFGAEMTQVWARRHGSGFVPKPHAALDHDLKLPHENADG